MPQTPAHRRYAARTAAFMTGYVALNVAAIFGAFDDLRRPGAWVFALAVAAPVAGLALLAQQPVHRRDRRLRQDRGREEAHRPGPLRAEYQPR